MSVVLTLFTAIGGYLLVGTGLRRQFRARLRALRSGGAQVLTDAGVVTLAERRMVARGVVPMMLGGSLLALFPQVPAALLVDSGPGTALGTVFSVLAWLAYDVVVGLGLLVAWAVLAFASRPVSPRMARQAGDAWRVAATSLPFGGQVSARRLRRDPALSDLPTTVEGVLELDRELSARFLSYQRDVDAASALPAMADLAVPTTAAAWEALLRCDELRPGGGVAVRDVVVTEYGQAVGAFATAMSVAEEAARRLVAGGFAPGERESVEDVQRLLSYVTSHATTPSERAELYAALASRLQSAAAGVEAGDGHAGAEGGAGARSHPWLDVSDRVR